MLPGWPCAILCADKNHPHFLQKQKSGFFSLRFSWHFSQFNPPFLSGENNVIRVPDINNWHPQGRCCCHSNPFYGFVKACLLILISMSKQNQFKHSLFAKMRWHKVTDSTTQTSFPQAAASCLHRWAEPPATSNHIVGFSYDTVFACSITKEHLAACHAERQHTVPS